jgi:preprotein translocase subunit SecA
LRKHTVEFDDVMNKQRTVIYADRRHILDGEDLRSRIIGMLTAEIESLVAQHLGADPDEWDLAPLMRPLRTINPLLPHGIEEVVDLAREEIIAELIANSNQPTKSAKKPSVWKTCVMSNDACCLELSTAIGSNT